jgi:hypothetical protein
MVYHVRYHLSGELGEQLPGQYVRAQADLPEGDELDDVAGGTAAVGVVESVIAVEFLHVVEIGVADSDYDERNGEVAVCDEEVGDCIHIVYFAVGDDEQDLVLIGSVRCIHVGNSEAFRDDGVEVGGS